MNRLQATPVADQKLLFQYFSVAHAAVVKAAKAAGRAKGLRKKASKKLADDDDLVDEDALLERLENGLGFDAGDRRDALLDRIAHSDAAAAEALSGAPNAAGAGRRTAASAVRDAAAAWSSSRRMR